jgi:quercetin dioxygenase-like cupin family protein
MPFSSRSHEIGDVAGPEHGLRRLIVRVQPVAADDVGHLHRHDAADQVLGVLQGEVLIEVGGEARVCREGEMGVVPAGAVHGFLGLGEPALLEVIGEQHAGTVFLLAGGGEVEVHRPGVPWDRPGSATDMAALASRLVAPERP